jgi:hypothetical protein
MQIGQKVCTNDHHVFLNWYQTEQYQRISARIISAITDRYSEKPVNGGEI